MKALKRMIKLHNIIQVMSSEINYVIQLNFIEENGALDVTLCFIETVKFNFPIVFAPGSSCLKYLQSAYPFNDSAEE